MDYIKTLLIASSFVILSGCGDDAPSNSLAEKTVRPYAEQGLLKGLELTDYKRDNGWVDTESANRYKVQYTFNYRLTKPLPEVVLDLAQDMEAEYNTAKKDNTGLFGGLEAMGQSMQLTMGANQWIQNQGDQFEKRRDAFLGPCESCVAFWNKEGQQEEVSTRRYAFVMAWAKLEELGFKDTAKVGDKVPRHAWATFMKTEKGWRAAS